MEKSIRGGYYRDAHHDMGLDMRIGALTGQAVTAALTGVAGLALAVAAAGAAEPEAATICPLPAVETAPDPEGEPVVRRLRATVSAGEETAGVETDLAEMAFVTSTRPNPTIEDIVQVPRGGDLTTLRVTVVNNSRHASPDGGITLSFPEWTRPEDRERIVDIAAPQGMALHVIPAGGRLFGRNGLEQTAGHLMVEVHGPWRPRQTRTLDIEVSGDAVPVLVRYRSAMSDDDGEYHNTPARSVALDQQGWPAYSCTMGSPEIGLLGQRTATVQSPDGESRD